MKLPSKVSSAGERKSPLGRLNKLLLAAIAVLFIFEAVVNNAKASNGSRLAELQREYDTLNAEVTNLELQVASYASLAHIKQYAQKELGMEPVEKNVLYINLPSDAAAGE